MPLFLDSPECVALRADVEGDQLNSRFQHIHKNKSVKTHRVMEGKSVIIWDEYRYLDKYWSMTIGCQQQSVYAKPMTASNRIPFYVKEAAHHHLTI